jgi:hypothetical protein
MADTADRLFGGIAVQFFCTPAPVRYPTAAWPAKNCVVRLIQQICLAPQQLPGALLRCNVAGNL